MLIVRNVFIVTMALLMQMPLHAQTASLRIEQATVITEVLEIPISDVMKNNR